MRQSAENAADPLRLLRQLTAQSAGQLPPLALLRLHWDHAAANLIAENDRLRIKTKVFFQQRLHPQVGVLGVLLHHSAHPQVQVVEDRLLRRCLQRDSFPLCHRSVCAVFPVIPVQLALMGTADNQLHPSLPFYYRADRVYSTDASRMMISFSCKKYPARSPVMPPNCFCDIR